MKRGLYHVSKGLLGILSNKKFSLKRKLLLYADYTKITIVACTGVIFPELTNSSVIKQIYLTSFGVTIYYPNIYTFFFLFNEIFCKAEYPIFSDLESYVDLGANIGVSLIWYHLFNPHLKIYAFEPDDINYRFLEKNIQKNKIKNCSIYKKAISNETNTVKFYRILDNIQNLDSGITINQPLPHEVFYVKTMRLSDILKRNTSISLVKMDIEGSEYLVFEDLKKTKTLEKIKKIVFESHIFSPTEQIAYIKIIRWLKQKGTFSSHQTSNYTAINFWQNNI